jgi:hypothetical protein
VAPRLIGPTTFGKMGDLRLDPNALREIHETSPKWSTDAAESKFGIDLKMCEVCDSVNSVASRLAPIRRAR